MKKTTLQKWKDLEGISWQKLADKIGVTKSTLIRIAQGKVAYVKPMTAKKIHRVTGLTAKDLL